ncbi:hypothetical protein [Providencia huaxiensis]|uniref:hypothetical protein n=1 Tax=Providencia huaxiensis TaxID=2027290 RepID=UPI0034E51009
MAFKHTPAPWNYNGNVCGAVESPTDDLIACAYPMHYENAEEMKANAHLIAAAPELLALLIKLDRIGGLGLSTHKEIQSVIAKALGQQ